MSTEETTTEPPRRRRLTVVAVAAAVLVAGGGAAYWASAATDDTSAGGGGAKPAPLALDGLGGPGGQESGVDSRNGIAPGEPDPAGGVYRARGELPKGPDTASVYRPSGRITAGEVKAVAETLGLTGTPKRSGDQWTVSGTESPSDAKGPAHSSGPVLTVGDEGGAGTWRFSQHPGSPAKVPGEKAPGTTVPSATGPVSEAAAERAVRPVLKAMDLGGARLDASSVRGDQRVVEAEPRLDGLPVHGWGGTFTVDADGELVRGHGRMGTLTKGAEYPVLTAAETLTELNRLRAPGHPATGRPGGTGSPGSPDSTDGTDGAHKDLPGTPHEAAPPTNPTDPTEPTAPTAPSRTVAVTDAEFGLTTRFSEGRPVLVPSWIFEAEAANGGSLQVTHPAVEPRYLVASRGGDGSDSGDGRRAEEPAAPPADPVRQSLSSYAPKDDGRTLTVTFWGGVCDTYRGTAEASKEKVTVSVQPREPRSDKPCIAMAEQQSVKVTLDEPLGDRTVVDARNGDPLPRK